MLGVTEVDYGSFLSCSVLAYVESSKLKRIGTAAFHRCHSLSSINLKSVEIVEASAFEGCRALADATFGKNMRFFGQWAFNNCLSLERFTLCEFDSSRSD